MLRTPVLQQLAAEAGYGNECDADSGVCLLHPHPLCESVSQEDAANMKE